MLEFDAAQAEFEQLRQWESKFASAIDAKDAATLERLRRSFRPMLKRLRNG